MKQEDLSNVPQENRDYSGLAHREPSQEEKNAAASDAVNVYPYVKLEPRPNEKSWLMNRFLGLFRGHPKEK